MHNVRFEMCWFGIRLGSVGVMSSSQLPFSVLNGRITMFVGFLTTCFNNLFVSLS